MLGHNDPHECAPLLQSPQDLRGFIGSDASSDSEQDVHCALPFLLCGQGDKGIDSNDSLSYSIFHMNEQEKMGNFNPARQSRNQGNEERVRNKRK
jgi:hypothetical protein